MNAPLQPVSILSIYKRNGKKLLLPERMSPCTPDTRNAILQLAQDVKKEGGQLILSDLFRSYDMQYQAYLDYTTGKKKAFSPKPGRSMHEAGRAMDIDLDALVISLKRFWELAAARGFKPIIPKPLSSTSEAWHFECRGSHERVRVYYKDRKWSHMGPSEAMAASAILALGIPVDRFRGKETTARLQSALIRLDHDPGPMDGDMGEMTRKAMVAVGLPDDLEEAWTQAAAKLRATFPAEYEVTAD